jgi:hypothetical protein
MTTCGCPSGSRGAPCAKPRTDQIAGAPLIRAAVIAAILPRVGLAESEIIRCG